MSKCDVLNVRNRRRQSYRVFAFSGGAPIINRIVRSAARSMSRWRRGLAIDIFEEVEAGNRRQTHAVNLGLKHRDVGLVPEADVRHVARDCLLRLPIELSALIVTLRRRSLLDQPI